ncbi:hypothetical protein BASA83_003601 [Batrachochytrium salamandrivorans]|nr:hypothetical protein BASA83_003601 [Batrachochytrium salamandrivorans]
MIQLGRDFCQQDPLQFSHFLPPSHPWYGPTTPAIAAKLLKLSDEDFVELVNAALHNPRLMSSLLSPNTPDAYTGRRVALIGDAAHTIHPLAGQGLNLGLADAQALSKAIVDAAKHGGDLGSDVVCDVYARERFAKSLSMLGAVDGVSRVFGGMLPSSLRGMGMNAINSSDLLKKAFMAMASA